MVYRLFPTISVSLPQLLIYSPTTPLLVLNAAISSMFATNEGNLISQVTQKTNPRLLIQFESKSSDLQRSFRTIAKRH